MASKEFKWDSEQRIGGFGSEKKRSEVLICTLNDKTYLQCTKEVKKQDGTWKRVKGTTLTVEEFKEIQAIFGDYELQAAFAENSSKAKGLRGVKLPK